MNKSIKNNYNSQKLSDILRNTFGFYIDKATHSCNAMPSFHTHAHYEILYIISGEKQITINNNESHILNNGSVALLKPYTIHQTRSASPNSQQRILIHINSELIADFCNFASYQIINCFDAPILQLSTHSQKLMNYFMTSLISLSPDDSDYVAKGKVFILALLQTLADEYNEQNASISVSATKTDFNYAKQISEYIIANYSKPITVADIALKFHFSKTHISRVFKNTMNTTLHKYLVSIRIIKAKEMLFEDNASIHSVAYTCGFNSPEAFTRAFKQHMGYSPSDYIKLKNSVN